MDRNRQSVNGPWLVTDTVRSDRKNLFSFEPNHEFHIATLVSGSQEQIDRFEDAIALLCEAPEMYALLLEILSKVQSGNGTRSLSDSVNVSELEALVERVGRPASVD